jgi:hypothetical protein
MDWNAAAQHVRHKLEIALARHEAVGQALTFQEGEALITSLSSGLIYDIRKMVDPTYDT